MTLKEWMDENCYGTYTLAKLLTKRGTPVTPQAILKWLNGTLPSKRYRDALEKITGGQVKPASFL